MSRWDMEFWFINYKWDDISFIKHSEINFSLDGIEDDKFRNFEDLEKDSEFLK